MNRLSVFIFCCVCGYARSQDWPTMKSVDGPLFLTPYIERNLIDQAQEVAKVHLPGSDISCYSGFLTVNEKYNSNLFFWYLPSETDPKNAPVILWLQGEFGVSSLQGFLSGNGELTVDNELLLLNNRYRWSKRYNVIYIDNPVGTGFSFTEDDAGYPGYPSAVGEDLYSALIQFFKLFPDLRQNDFYIAGESYAGKYIPAIAFTIDINNEYETKINLKGIAIGNGHIDPENMMEYSDYLYQLGLVDSATKKMFKDQEEIIVNLIKERKFDEARKDWITMLQSISPHIDYHNYLPHRKQIHVEPNADYRRSINVGNMTFQDGSATYDHLKNDIMDSVKYEVEALLGKYRVMLYNGQLAIVNAYPMMENFISKLEWDGSVDYHMAVRKEWMVNNELAGFYKNAKGLTEVLVRDAGVMVPQEQPQWALDLITRFIENRFE